MSEIFRKSAMQHMMAPEQLDQQVKIIRPMPWVIVLAIASIVFGLSTWVFFGRITNSVNVRGVVFPSEGVTTIHTGHSGIASGVLFRSGDSVNKGDILVIIPNQQVLDDINELALMEETDNVSKEMLEQLRESYSQSSVIRSPVDGIIQSIVSSNSYLFEGDSIATIVIESDITNTRQVMAYASVNNANKLKLGMEAQVSPEFAPREEFGYITGVVSSISALPTTRDALLRSFGSIEYAEDILPNENFIEIRITLANDPDHPNLFQWSNQKGSRLSIETGTICDIALIAENNRPIELLIR